MDSETLWAAIFALGMFAGVFVIYMAMRQRSHLLEMQHRERMAMIERGLTTFDDSRVPSRPFAGSRRGTSPRMISLGIVVAALGLGLMTIISIAAGVPQVGVGIGGAVTIVGIAFIVIGVVSRPQLSEVVPPQAVPPTRDPSA